jgi:hypothetical protein
MIKENLMKKKQHDRVFTVAPEGSARVEQGKTISSSNTSSSEVIFLTHILSLKTAALMHMGIVPSQEDTFDLETAQHIIDTLTVLQEKSKGNLSTEEQKHLTASIYELQVAFIKVRDT